MRSVVVVLPASTWAMMPMLRISERAVVRAMASFRLEFSVHTVGGPGRRAGPAHVFKMICADESSALLDPMPGAGKNRGFEGRKGRHPIEIASEVQSRYASFVNCRCPRCGAHCRPLDASGLVADHFHGELIKTITY